MKTPDFAHMTVADALRYAAKRARENESTYRNLYAKERFEEYVSNAESLETLATQLENDARRAERQKARRK